MSDRKYAKIMNVLEKDGITPKHRDMWNRDIIYFDYLIQKGFQGMWFEDNGKTHVKTSCIESIKEDENNIYITTENSVFYIKKIRNADYLEYLNGILDPRD